MLERAAANSTSFALLGSYLSDSDCSRPATVLNILLSLSCALLSSSLASVPSSWIETRVRVTRLILPSPFFDRSYYIIIWIWITDTRPPSQGRRRMAIDHFKLNCARGSTIYLKTPSELLSIMSSQPSRGSPFMAQLWGIPVAPLPVVSMQKYRANSLNLPYRLKDAMETGRVLLGTGLTLPTLPVARLMATLNYDFVFIDAEHTPMGPDLLHDLIKTLNYHSEGQTATIVRAPTHGHEWSAWILDAGASGIIFPHTENAAQAQKLIDQCRFPPSGHRSFPPFANVIGHTDGTPEGNSVLDVYNKNAAIFVQIESVEGVKNVEEICALPGVDGIMIGTADLRLDLGLGPAFVGEETAFNEAMETIQLVARKHNKPIFGFAMGEPLAVDRLQRGWKLLVASADCLALTAGLTGPLSQLRELVGDYENDHSKEMANKIK